MLGMGAIAQNGSTMRLSIQLYTLRDACTADIADALRRVKSFGLEYVELAGLNGLPAAELKSVLDGVGLQVSGSHVDPNDLRDEPGRIVDESLTLGNRTVIVPWIGEEWYRDGWRQCAFRLQDLARPVLVAGLTFAYHNLAFEFAVEGGKPGLDVLFESSSPASLKAQIDTYWVYHAGLDPAAYILKWGGRVVQAHLKDGGTGPEPSDAIAGEGALDFGAILDACAQAGVEFGSIEMDRPPGEPFEAVRRCVEFFHSRGLR